MFTHKKTHKNTMLYTSFYERFSVKQKIAFIQQFMIPYLILIMFPYINVADKSSKSIFSRDKSDVQQSNKRGSNYGGGWFVTTFFSVFLNFQDVFVFIALYSPYILMIIYVFLFFQGGGGYISFIPFFFFSSNIKPHPDP